MFAPIFVPDELLDAVSDRAWLQALLDAEAALAGATAAAGAIPPDAAETIRAACRAERFDASRLVEGARAAGNPVEPLVRELAAAVGNGAAGYVHWGATSQDILDTALMLVSRSCLELTLGRVDAVAGACAELADRHRATPMAGRTLLQHAVPTTFGAKAAGWLVAVVEAGRRLDAVRTGGLAAQLGGAAGTLAALGDRGMDVLRLYAQELGLAEPAVPWHTDRTRIAGLAAALETAAAVHGKIGLDVALLAQTEVGEVAEAAGGASSTMPHKRNPVGSTLAIACAQAVHGYAAVLTGAALQEHERALGSWHAEWPALSGALAYAGGAAAAMHRALSGLHVDAARMRANLDLTGGLVVSERLSFLLAERMGRRAAHEVVSDAAGRSGESGRPLGEELLDDARVGLGRGEIEAVLDPAAFVGSAEAFVDRALALYREGGKPA